MRLAAAAVLASTVGVALVFGRNPKSARTSGTPPNAAFTNDTYASMKVRSAGMSAIDRGPSWTDAATRSTDAPAHATDRAGGGTDGAARSTDMRVDGTDQAIRGTDTRVHSTDRTVGGTVGATHATDRALGSAD